MYHHVYCARVVAEMVRPSVPLPNYGGNQLREAENCRVSQTHTNEDLLALLLSCLLLDRKKSLSFLFPVPLMEYTLTRILRGPTCPLPPSCIGIFVQISRAFSIRQLVAKATPTATR